VGGNSSKREKKADPGETITEYPLLIKKEESTFGAKSGALTKGFEGGKEMRA